MVLRIGIVVLAFLTGGYMIVDALHALYTDNYITIGGHLGPWTAVLASVHIPYYTLAAKLLFLAAGSLYIVVAIDYAVNDLRSATGIAGIAIATLWYLPFGTLFSLIVLALLWLEERQRAMTRANS